MSIEITKDFLVALVGSDVVFNDKINDYEDYPEEGMKARILSVSFDRNSHVADRTHRIEFDYSVHDAHNLVRETANYYDADSVPCLTARQAGFYREKDYFFIGGYVEDMPFDQIEEGVEKAA